MAAVLTRFFTGNGVAGPDVVSKVRKAELKHHMTERKMAVHAEEETVGSQEHTSGLDDDDQSDIGADATSEGQEEQASDESSEGYQNNIRPSRKRKRISRQRKTTRRDQKLDDTDSDASASPSENSPRSAFEAQWEGESEGASGEETKTGLMNPSSCIFCGEDEDNDPNVEFEEYLACAVCGDNAHRQCAREARSLTQSQDAQNWRCPGCIANGIEPAPQTATERSTSAAPKVARDLLPAARGVIKPGSHSVFNTLILDDDPMDGSRSLRKRKPSDESDDRASAETRKRSRRHTSPDELARHMSRDVATLLSESKQKSPSLEPTNRSTSPRNRPSRVRAAQRFDLPPFSILEKTHDVLMVCFRAESSKLADLDNEKRRRKRRERDRVRKESTQQEIPQEEISHYPGLQYSNFTALSFQAVEPEGEDKKKPYGGILSEAEGDTTRTFPQAADRKKFEDARQKAEERWKEKVRAAAAAATETGRPAVKASSNTPSKIKCINFGGYEIDTWHAAPYPEEYSRNRVLYICEFCLKYMNSDYVAWRHKLKCPAKHPPGDEIYRDGAISFFEVDGRKNPVYCQNLCLLAKLFLGSKTLYYDVEPFLFYIMTETDEYGCHFVGYFSKEKRPSSQNNVSCILVLPIHQRRGFGHLLIDFSYLLTRVEEKTGSPEKPLSDMGLVSYRSYWRLVMCQQLLEQKKALSITGLSERTGMTADDIVCALESLRALVRDPVTRTYALRLDYAFYEQYVKNYESKGYTKINSDALIWVAYVMGRDNSHYETSAPLHTVAQREDNDASRIEPEEGVQQLTADIISENDHAISVARSTNSGFMSTQDEDEETFVESGTTPFPTLDNGVGSSAAPMQGTSQVSETTTPWRNEAQNSDSPIPPSRFEVFPPLPSTAGRRRGRPALGRGSGRRPASLRNTMSAGGFSMSPNKQASATRTRSRLAESTNGAEEDDVDVMAVDSPSHRAESRVKESQEADMGDG